MKNKVTFMLCVLAFVCTVLPVYSQNAPLPNTGSNISITDSKPASANEEKWEFRLIPYTWLIAIDTEATVRNHTANSKISFSDILKDMNLAGQIHFEAQKKKWGFFVDPTYLKLSQDGTLKDGRDIRLQVEQWLIEFGGIYQLGKWSLDGKGKRSITVDALGGGRFWYLSANLDTSSALNPSKTVQWIDPIIGARLNAEITDKIIFNLRGDIGGFSVGSDFSWNAQGIFGYRFAKNITGLIGYRALYVDYKEGTNIIRYNITIHGPIMGLCFSF